MSHPFNFPQAPFTTFPTYDVFFFSYCLHACMNACIDTTYWIYLVGCLCVIISGLKIWCYMTNEGFIPGKNEFSLSVPELPIVFFFLGIGSYEVFPFHVSMSIVIWILFRHPYCCSIMGVAFLSLLASAILKRTSWVSGSCNLFTPLYKYSLSLRCISCAVDVCVEAGYSMIGCSLHFNWSQMSVMASHCCPKALMKDESSA